MKWEERKTFYNVKDDARLGKSSRLKYEDLILGLLQSFVQESDIVLELGCGKGDLKNCHRNYIGIDISFLALNHYLVGKRCIQAYIEMLPIKDASVAFVFSVDTLEHIPQPEIVFEEIDRILRPGGVAVIAPAWFVRPWASRGLDVKQFKDLGFRDKLEKVLIPLRNTLMYKGLTNVPRRIVWEIMYVMGKKPVPFRYKRLRPNLRDFLQGDCDAFSSMDPYAALLYWKSRGYKVLSLGPRILSRIFLRHKPLVIQKP